MLYEKPGQKKTFEPVPRKEHQAVCSMVIDLGKEFFEKYNKWNEKILIGFELPNLIADYQNEDGTVTKKPRVLSRRFKRELYDGHGNKSELHEFIVDWLGRDLKTNEEGFIKFDPKALIGLNGNIDVSHNVKGDKTYADIKNIRPLRDEQTKHAPEGQTVFQLCDVPEGENPVDHFPATAQEWIKKAFMKSQQALSFMGTQKSAEQPPAAAETGTQDMDDDFPF